MLPLPSTDLVPISTLRRIIARWAASAASSCSPVVDLADSSASRRSPASLIRMIGSSDDDLLAAQRELATYLGQDSHPVIRRKRKRGGQHRGVMRVLVWIVASDDIDDVNKKRMAASLAVDTATSARSLAHVMHPSSSIRARINTAKLVELLLTMRPSARRRGAAGVGVRCRLHGGPGRPVRERRADCAGGGQEDDEGH